MKECVKCGTRHYRGEPYPGCYHREKDKRDIEKWKQVYGEVDGK